MAKITKITVSAYSNTYITVSADIDKGDSVSYYLPLVDIIGRDNICPHLMDIGDIRAIATWLKGYCHSKQSVETIATILFKDLVKIKF